MMLRSEAKLISFHGNGPYCYSNAASMLLSTVGEQVSPREMEAYTGVGLGAFWLPKEKFLFFSSISNPPDLGITRALRLLGFSFEEMVTNDPGKPPFEQLKSDLTSSAAVLGPLDMGYLTHNPLHKRMMGADHFVLAYRFEKDGVMIHDPEGFPSVLLPFRQLELAWRAENIGYHRGHYRYWMRPRRVRHPSPDELYESNLESYASEDLQGYLVLGSNGSSWLMENVFADFLMLSGMKASKAASKDVWVPCAPRLLLSMAA